MLALSIAKTYKNISYFEKEPSIFNGNEEVILSNLSKILSAKNNKITITFKNEADLNFATILFLWLTSPHYDDLYLKYLEKKRLKFLFK